MNSGSESCGWPLKLSKVYQRWPKLWLRGRPPHCVAAVSEERSAVIVMDPDRSHRIMHSWPHELMRTAIL